MFKMFSNKKGFSLVELIVVIAILGVISAIAIPAVLNTLADSKIKADVATAQALSKAINLAVVSANSNTTTSDDIAAVSTATALSAVSGNLLTELQKSYPDLLTMTPQSGGTFSITVNPTANPFACTVTFGTTPKKHTIDANGVDAIS